MKKKKRHLHILRIIEKENVQTQHDMLRELKKVDIDVSQSTLSKDLKELGIIKVRGKESRFRFVQTKERDTYHVGIMLKRELNDFLRETTAVGNLVLLKTIPGNASGVSKFLDEIGWPEIVGTLASVDTVLAVTKSEKDANNVIKKIDEVIHMV